MHSLDALRTARQVSLDDLDLDGSRERLDAELSPEAPRPRTARSSRPILVGAGVLAIVALTAAIVTTSPTAPEPQVASGAPVAPLLTTAPDLAPSAGHALRITQSTSVLLYPQEAARRFTTADEGAANRTSASGAVVEARTEESFVPADQAEDAIVRSSPGGDGGPVHVTAYYGHEELLTEAWMRWNGGTPAREASLDSERIRPTDPERSELAVPSDGLFGIDRSSLPTSEAAWADHWAQRAQDAGEGVSAPMTALTALGDPAAFARADPGTRVLVINALTRVPGMAWSLDGSSAVFDAQGVSPDPNGTRRALVHTLRVTVDLDRGVVTDYRDFVPSAESKVVPADVPDLHVHTEIDADATMPGA